MASEVQYQYSGRMYEWFDPAGLLPSIPANVHPLATTHADHPSYIIPNEAEERYARGYAKYVVSRVYARPHRTEPYET